jgi:hypothetical protein
MKKAPTIGTTMNACGAGPWRRVSACMLAMAVAVAPIAKPQNAPVWLSGIFGNVPPRVNCSDLCVRDAVPGGQASLGLMGIYGHNDTPLTGTLSGTLTLREGVIPFARSDSFNSSLTGFGDLYPQLTLRWKQRREHS